MKKLRILLTVALLAAILLGIDKFFVVPNRISEAKTEAESKGFKEGKARGFAEGKDAGLAQAKKEQKEFQKKALVDAKAKREKTLRIAAAKRKAKEQELMNGNWHVVGGNIADRVVAVAPAEKEKSK